MYIVSIPTVITNGHFNKETTLKELKRAKADRVMLALTRDLPYHFTSPENLALLKELIAYYKENGFDTCVWLGETSVTVRISLAMNPTRLYATSAAKMSAFIAPWTRSSERILPHGFRMWRDAART